MGSDGWVGHSWPDISMKTYSLAEKLYNIFWQKQADHIWVVRENGKQKIVSWNCRKEKSIQGGLTSKLKDPYYA